jgi:LCP family protein required for cell wall assembly
MIKEIVRQHFYSAIGVGLIVAYVLATATLIRLNILPTMYFIIVILLSAPIIIWIGTLHFKKRVSIRKKLITSSLSLILIAVSLYIFTSLNSTLSFLSSLGSETQVYESYSIIAKKERHITLNSAGTAALVKNDTNSDIVSVEVGKLTQAKQTKFEGISMITTSINENQSDLGIMTNSQLELVKETEQAFYGSVEVLATFKVKVNSGTTSVVNTSKPFIVYISGIDTYGEISSVSRSDVNMLAVINPTNYKILLVNTPRDYYVQLHGTSGLRDKLTHAGIYGIDTSKRTMEDLYGVPIDAYMRVNFSSLISVVDTIGGVSVYSDSNFKSFKEGYNTLNGAQALEFSRERYSLAEGDKARGKNQQRVIEAIIEKLNNPSILINYSSILSIFQSSLQTDIKGDNVTDIVKKQLEEGKSWRVESISVDGSGSQAPTFSTGNAILYVMEPDIASVAAVTQKIQSYLQ